MDCYHQDCCWAGKENVTRANENAKKYPYHFHICFFLIQHLLVCYKPFTVFQNSDKIDSDSFCWSFQFFCGVLSLEATCYIIFTDLTHSFVFKSQNFHWSSISVYLLVPEHKHCSFCSYLWKPERCSHWDSKDVHSIPDTYSKYSPIAQELTFWKHV